MAFENLIGGVSICPRCALNIHERGESLGSMPREFVANRAQLIFCGEHNPNQEDIDEATTLLTSEYNTDDEEA